MSTTHADYIPLKKRGRPFKSDNPQPHVIKRRAQFRKATATYRANVRAIANLLNTEVF
jgi:hypothetical protein